MLRATTKAVERCIAMAMIVLVIVHKSITTSKHLRRRSKHRNNNSINNNCEINGSKRHTVAAISGNITATMSCAAAAKTEEDPMALTFALITTTHNDTQR